MPDLSGPCPEVARRLLGCQIVSLVGGRRVSGLVVETEAYPGPHDPASHAAERIGRTRRNASMFGPPGMAYVYFTYGMHWCLNVVTGPKGHPAAVLVRALDPLEGREVMKERRGGRKELTSGPARLCQALGVTGELDGRPLDRAPLWLEPRFEVGDPQVGISERIGIRRAEDWPLRYYIRGHEAVARPRD